MSGIVGKNVSKSGLFGDFQLDASGVQFNQNSQGVHEFGVKTFNSTTAKVSGSYHRYRGNFYNMTLANNTWSTGVVFESEITNIQIFGKILGLSASNGGDGSTGVWEISFCYWLNDSNAFHSSSTALTNSFGTQGSNYTADISVIGSNNRVRVRIYQNSGTTHYIRAQQEVEIWVPGSGGSTNCWVIPYGNA